MLHTSSCTLKYYVQVTIFTYTHTVGAIADEQKEHGLKSIGVATKNTVFVMLVGLAK